MRVLVLIAALALGACSNSFEAERKRIETAAKQPHFLEISASEVFARSKTEIDPHRNVVTVEGPHVRKVDQWAIGSALAGYSMIAKRANRVGAKHEIWLLIVTDSSSWKHFKHAFSFGKRLEVASSPGTVGSCGQISCSLFESATINIPIADLERGIAAGGYELLISGSGGELKMKVPAPYIKGFLDKLRAS